MKNPMHVSLAAGRPVVGFWHVIQDLAITETFRHARVDFLVVDMQHLAMSLEAVERIVIALQPSDVSVVVRTPVNEPAMIGQILDVGADGVIVPMLNNVDDVRLAVSAVRYPPEGVRSWGPRRLPHYDSADDYARNANENAVVLVQVETAEALANLDEVVAFPGITGVMVGPTDLAISMGYMHDRKNPAVTEAAMRVLDRCAEHGVPFGFFAGPLEEALEWLDRGAQIVACETDAWFIARGVERLVDAFDEARRPVT